MAFLMKEINFFIQNLLICNVFTHKKKLIFLYFNEEDTFYDNNYIAVFELIIKEL